MNAAFSCYKATLNVTTGLSAPFNNLAIIYKQQVTRCQTSSMMIGDVCLVISYLMNNSLLYSSISILGYSGSYDILDACLNLATSNITGKLC